jgi:hypothetical protein
MLTQISYDSSGMDVQIGFLGEERPENGRVAKVVHIEPFKGKGIASSPDKTEPCGAAKREKPLRDIPDYFIVSAVWICKEVHSVTEGILNAFF